MYRKLSERKVILRQEYENLPKDTDMREALQMMRAEERACEQIRRESDKLEERIRELIEILKEKKKKALEIAEALYLTCSYDIFKEAKKAAEEYGKHLISLIAAHEMYLRSLMYLRERKEHLEDLDADMEQIRYDLQEIQKEIRRKTEEQNRLLNMIQNQTAGQLELLSQFMDELERTESREQYDRILGKIVVVGTYLKRRKNLVLTQYASDGNLLTMEDLRQSLAESCDSLKLCRIRAAYYVENVDVQLNADDILKCYDTFEWLVERLLDIMQSVFYRVSQIDDALRISVHIVSEADLRGFMSERPELKVQQEDENEWFIRCIVFRKRGGR